MNGLLQQFPIGRVACASLVAFALLATSIASSHCAAAESEKPAAGDELSIEQARLADRYQRLETVLGRLAELQASTDPKQAKILREAIAKSHEQDLSHRFESIVKLLEEERLSAAATRQTDLEKELDDLLSLLLKADRDNELDSERQRVKKYLQEVGRLIRLQQGLNARTESGDDNKRLATDQKNVGEQTGKLSESMEDAKNKESKDGDEAKPSDAKSGDWKQKEDSKPRDDKKSSKGESDKKGKSPDDAKGEPSPGEPGEQSPGKPSDSSEGEPSEGQPSDNKSPPSPSKPSDGQPPPSGQPGEESQQSESPPNEEPTERAAKRLQSAQSRMQQAQEKLDKAERDGAAAEQKKAIEELQQAKAELERVLRQLREEEMERTLTLLAARFHKMLEAQQRVYEGTVRLDHVAQADRDHDHEIESARLSREEAAIGSEADRALVLLREEGSSVAFPETIGLMREDMQRVTERLGEFKVGTLTQGLEQDIIESLEEAIGAMEKALKDLEKKKTPPGQSPGGGQQSDPPLVDKLAELRMIRSLQVRINRRTEKYGKVIEGEQAEAPEMLDALQDLAKRQQRVYQATDDLNRGRND